MAEAIETIDPRRKNVAVVVVVDDSIAAPSAVGLHARVATAAEVHCSAADLAGYLLHACIGCFASELAS